MSKSPKMLSLDTPWAIGEEKYSEILQALSGIKVEKIIEFGSGRSTVRLQQDFPNAQIISIENKEEFYTETLELLQNHQAKNVVVLHRPIKQIRIGIRSYLTYSLKSEDLNGDIDFALIDGPVESETLRGREAPLYMIFNRLKVNGLIVLDDYHRDSSKIVVKNWLNTYGNNLRLLNSSHEGIAVLQKTGNQDLPYFPTLDSLIDNYLVNSKLLARKIKKYFLVKTK